jgi:hypothetical protein
MASEKKGKKSAETGGTPEGPQATGQEAAKGLLEEIEKTAEYLVGEVKALFDSLTEKVSGVAGAAAETTAAVAEKVAIKEPAHLIRGLIEDVRQAGETSLGVIADGFEGLRRRLVSSEEPPAAEAVAPKKKAAAKKAAAKKTATKKATTKKAAAKKATTKKATTKKATTKKAVAKKVAAEAAPPAEKTVARKKAPVRKKIAPKPAPEL